MASQSVAKMDLPKLMQKLPQEIYDEIYEMNFTAIPGERVVGRTSYLETLPKRFEIEKDLFMKHYDEAIEMRHGARGVDRGGLFQKPDSVVLLHVDKASREKFAKSFFGGDGVVFTYSRWRMLNNFLRSLAPGHFHLVQEIRIAKQ